MSSMKIAVSFKLAPEIERLLNQKTIVIDNGALSRSMSQALQPLRNKGKLIVGRDQYLGKSVIRVEGVSSHTRNRSVFELFLE